MLNGDYSTHITKIRKRDGRIVEFEKTRITNAIFKAAQAVGGHDRQRAEELAQKVVAILEYQYSPDKIPTVEQVQDLVESVLMKMGHAKTAKAYILYREQHQKLREDKAVVNYVEGMVDGYLKQKDWRVNENSNVNYSFSGLLLHTAGSLTAHYTLNNVYPPEISDAHRRGDFHLHDLSMGIIGYCAGWSIRQIVHEGFNGVPGKTDSRPAKHLNAVTWQLINFIGTLQNEWAGAQAFSSFDTYLAPFVRVENLSYDDVKQAIQGFIFNMNISSRWGGQTPFSNITLDWMCPEDMRKQKAVVGGETLDFTYGDCQKEMDMINQAFIEVMTTGDAKGRVFTFPIPTYNITKDFDWEHPNAKLLFEMTAKYGIPYFQNFVNSSLIPSDVRSMCCRLRMDLRELRARGGGLFGSGEMTGSVGVVTINLPRIGYFSKTKEEFFDRLGNIMDLGKQALEIKRKLVQHNMDNGLLPFSKRYLVNLHNHFNTIGLNGMNEAIMNFLGRDVTIAQPEGKAFAIEVLNFMRDRLSKYQEETGHLFNLEATPAEGVSHRFARIDKKKYPDIITQGEKDPYYTNSTHLPVSHTEDLFEALQHQDELQVLYTGGTVLHGFLGERIDDWRVARELVKKVAYNFKLPYFTLTPTFSVCPEHGYIAGEHFTCPHHIEMEKEVTT